MGFKTYLSLCILPTKGSVLYCGMACLCLAAGWMFLYVHADVLFRMHVNKMLPQLDQVVCVNSHRRFIVHRGWAITNIMKDICHYRYEYIFHCTSNFSQIVLLCDFRAAHLRQILAISSTPYWGWSCSARLHLTRQTIIIKFFTDFLDIRYLCWIRLDIKTST